ncbi:proline-rich transmembrane protein 4 [Hypomesus transpacificus]|uniref:proline-rich transmembrane protein 4 n=1 Tax=Hypomesus transpacificus TaxID=137520 RepID=UPI001F07A79F|nr:proline-rich transmembrane protein 4 [Hypomesus transpacificus]
MVEDTGKGFLNFTKDFSNTGSNSTGKDKGRTSNEEWWDPETNETSVSPDWNVSSLTPPSNTSGQPLNPADPDDITSKQPLRPSLVLIPPLFVPLYSDWNSAMATWGLAWEAHVYGLASVFAGFGLISVLCLLGLPLRCPAGSPYFTVLHLLLLATGGVRAFSLLYDAYSHQDRLPLLGSLLLSELPLACLTSAFSLSFILLSQRSRMRLSLRFSLSAPLSTPPRPCLLLGLSLLHFGASLGCVGLLQLLPSLPALLLLPQGLFVSLCLLLSCSYLLFYCHVRADNTHIYQLRDTGEEGGSPEIGPPARCPFAEVGEWGKAAGAGVGAALCLMGCGGLQLYGILHALGLGGVSAGAGFQPWPWWGYQMGCRLCEVGVCLSLSLIGAQPLLCHTSSSSRTTSNPRPGSWSRLPCVSTSTGPNHSPRAENKSPTLPPHYPWSPSQQDKLVVCEVITKSPSENLPLYSLADPPQNGPGLPSNPSHTRSSIPPLLPNPPSPPGRPRDGVDWHFSLDSATLYSDSTVDLRPPSPINLSRSIDQALFSETLFPHGLFSPPRLFHASSSLSLTSPSQGDSYPGSHSASSPLYRTSSCGDVDQDDSMSRSRLSQPDHDRTPGSPDPCGWKRSNASSVGQVSLSSSSQGLCSSPIDKVKSRFCPRATRGQHLPQSSLPRSIPHMPHHRRYRTLSSASQYSQGEGRLAGTEHLSESRQLERDLAVQAEFINVCRQIDSLSVCSDTIDL